MNEAIDSRVVFGISTHTETLPAKLSSCAPAVMVFQERVAYNRLRRIMDILAAGVLLVVAAPLVILAGLLILLEDGSPVFFRQQRVGRFGRLFTIYKLRTMRKEKCVDSFSPTALRDPRVTRVGHLLRRSSIDELPQLVNILRGEMTFVGPRPEMPFLVREYQSWQHLRHLVTPGVTGFWQTTCRSTVPLHTPQATLLDLDYIRRASHSTDAAVLVKTIRTLISTEGAY
ncbi:MAG: sugar transferase [Candidatus Velthaea sp.]|jgi:lipopolysaccharide/colanic/teichoic acid biosynthesis glycosyltransferase